MAKFNGRARVAPATTFGHPAVAGGRGIVTTDVLSTGRTFEGAPGYARNTKSELFLLAVTNLVGEKTFYETGEVRDTRFADLVQQATVADPQWMLGFITWLRGPGMMRSASLVAAAEATAAMLRAKVPGARQLINAALQRADEPGEFLGYWISKYGRNLPKPVKRGVADAVERLYTQWSTLKYDTTQAIRFGDVLELVHPTPKQLEQCALFPFLLERRHGRPEPSPRLAVLPMLRKNRLLRGAAPRLPDILLDAEQVKEAGFTWQNTLSLGGELKLDKRQLWEAIIPSMGYEALLKNLRNFSEANIAVRVAGAVRDRLTDPEQVKRSMQFPLRFWAAYKAVEDMLFWHLPLEQALQLSLSNIPTLPGRTLILVDLSGSMVAPLSARSTVTRAEAASIFGVALALRNAGNVTLVKFGGTSVEVPVQPGASVLPVVQRNFMHNMGGTYTATAARNHFAGHDRVVIITDEQASDGDPASFIPGNVPLYTWNLAGYPLGYGAGNPRSYSFGGFTDKAYGAINLLEAGVNEQWPWETQNA